MAKITPTELVELLVKKGFLTGDQAADCLNTRKKAIKLGLKQTILDIAVQKEYLTEARKTEARRALTAVSESEAPVSIPGYQIGPKIGQGGMGSVYKGKQISLDRSVAIKILAKRFSEDELFVQRFLREARSAAKIDHPNVVRAIDAGKSAGTYYFVMEFVPGETLRETLKREGPMSQERALEITEQIANALSHAHRMGIIHRDIKPDNIMITSGGTAKLSDLGLARETYDPSVTLVGTIVGTPHYMSPEQIEGDVNLDIRSDIYSLGATLYQMLTNEFPFRGTTPAAVIARHLSEKRPDPAEKNPNVSRHVSNLVRRMMARDRTRRPANPDELIALIAGTRDAMRKPGTLPTTGRTAAARAGKTPRGKAGFPIIPVAGGAAVVAAAVIVLLVILRAGDQPASRPEAPGDDRIIGPAVADVKPPDEVPRPDRPISPEDKAEGELRNALAGKRDTPREILKAIDLLEGIAKRYPTTSAAAKATSKISAVRAVVYDRLSDMKRRIGELLTRSDFKSAEQLCLKFLDDFPRDPWKKRVEGELTRLRTQAREHFGTVKRKVNELVSEKKFLEAHELLMSAVDEATAETARTAADRLKSLEDDQRKARRREGKRIVLLVKARDEAFEHLQKGNVFDVLKAYRKLREDKRFATAEDLLTEDIRQFERVEGIFRKVEKNASSKIGRDFTIQGIVGRLIRAEAGEITIASAGGGEFSQPVWKLKVSEILELAGLKPDGETDPVGVAMLYMCKEEIEKARTILKGPAGKKAGIEVNLSLLEQFEKHVAERKAGDLISSAESLAGAKQWAKARSALNSLRDGYRNTKAFAGARRKLKDLEDMVAQKVRTDEPKPPGKPKADGPRIPGFVVPVRFAGVDTYKGKYEFDNASEIDDWEVDNAFPGSNWKIEAGRLVGKGETTIKNKIPFVGDILIDATVDSNSSFSLHIGEYEFSWYRFSSSVTVRITITKKGITMRGGRGYLRRIPMGKLPMRWMRKGRTISWHWGANNKLIAKLTDKQQADEDSTICIESNNYLSFTTLRGPARRVERRCVAIDDLNFYGRVDRKRLAETRRK